jgi:threonine/homoserine/homoserine lactone efflux protein
MRLLLGKTAHGLARSRVVTTNSWGGVEVTRVNMGGFLQGCIIGVSIAAPVGPIGVLCIRHTLASGRLTGLISGLGAATADAIYGCVAAFGLTIVSSFLLKQQLWLQWSGGLFLLYLGIRTFLAKSSVVGTGDTNDNLMGVYASTFCLTLANPMTILSFVAIFAGMGLGGPHRGLSNAILMVGGVFTGSTFWWMFLSGSVGLIRSRLHPSSFLWVNRISGSIIAIFGVWVLAGLKNS